MITVTPVPAFSDNYLWLLHRDGVAAVVDPGDAAPVLEALRQRQLRLCAILITHHHADHVGGLAGLLQAHPVPVYGPRAEAGKIRGLTHLLDDGDRLELPELGLRFEILAVPGHTLGHIAYHHAGAARPREGDDDDGLLFCGDTLFASGCGRLFEGTPRQMYGSLQKLAALPQQTAVYCAHEYTLSNLDFALAVEPANAGLAAEMGRVRALRAEGRPSLPVTLARERAFNPFLRCDVPAVGTAAAGHAGRQLCDAVDVFAALRQWKDGYRARTQL